VSVHFNRNFWPVGEPQTLTISGVNLHPTTCPYGQVLPDALEGDNAERVHEACNCGIYGE
jgi:hypothetical protein